MLVEIGRAYLDQGKTAEAAEYAQRAKDVNSKCAVAYLLSGDVALKLNDVNKPAVIITRLFIWMKIAAKLILNMHRYIKV